MFSNDAAVGPGAPSASDGASQTASLEVEGNDVGDIDIANCEVVFSCLRAWGCVLFSCPQKQTEDGIWDG